MKFKMLAPTHSCLNLNFTNNKFNFFHRLPLKSQIEGRFDFSGFTARKFPAPNVGVWMKQAFETRFLVWELFGDFFWEKEVDLSESWVVFMGFEWGGVTLVGFCYSGLCLGWNLMEILIFFVVLCYVWIEIWWKF